MKIKKKTGPKSADYEAKKVIPSEHVVLVGRWWGSLFKKFTAATVFEIFAKFERDRVEDAFF